MTCAVIAMDGPNQLENLTVYSNSLPILCTPGTTLSSSRCDISHLVGNSANILASLGLVKICFQSKKGTRRSFNS